MWFTSDNAAGASPEVMDAVMRVNSGYQMAYGGDDVTDRARAMIRERFEVPDAAIHFVSTGTSANALALACYCPPWGAIYAHKAAHVEMDECGAPEFFAGGAKMTLIDGADGRIDEGGLTATLAVAASAGVHNVQRGALTITNATEAGTVYSVDQVKALTTAAHAHGVPVHMDGTRFANAVSSLGRSPAELSWKAGVDVLCLGGTKNGALAAEAVIFFDPEKAWEFELRRKRGGHLFSKMRFLTAQFEALMTDDLWLRNATHSNAMAARLAEGIMTVSGASMMHPREANLVFAGLPRGAHEAARAKGAAYHYWPGGQPESGPADQVLTSRFVCSSQTTSEEVDAIVETFKTG
jgi:threonine aldolase